MNIELDEFDFARGSRGGVALKASVCGAVSVAEFDYFGAGGRKALQLVVHAPGVEPGALEPAVLVRFGAGGRLAEVCVPEDAKVVYGEQITEWQKERDGD